MCILHMGHFIFLEGWIFFPSTNPMCEHILFHKIKGYQIQHAVIQFRILFLQNGGQFEPLSIEILYI